MRVQAMVFCEAIEATAGDWPTLRRVRHDFTVFPRDNGLLWPAEFDVGFLLILRQAPPSPQVTYRWEMPNGRRYEVGTIHASRNEEGDSYVFETLRIIAPEPGEYRLLTSVNGTDLPPCPMIVQGPTP